jgi:hypothetical protein
MGSRPTGRGVSSAAAPPSIPTRGIDHGCEPSRAGARCLCARRARRGRRTGRSGSTGVRRVAARGCPPCWARLCAGSAAMCWCHERALSSAGERRPYKAEVVGSIPTAPTPQDRTRITSLPRTRVGHSRARADALEREGLELRTLKRPVRDQIGEALEALRGSLALRGSRRSNGLYAPKAASSPRPLYPGDGEADDPGASVPSSSGAYCDSYTTSWLPR